MNLVKSRITHDKFKAIFEILDHDYLGTLSKLDYVKAVFFLNSKMKII